ncbi:MAG: ACP S-malonyltransferase [Coriobacteriaceae bacterium]|nr:ACP S-malonyltransferase [Coriobacteriaceae bacterium]
MTVWMLPGQGAQKPGMGADLLELPQVAQTFALASDVLGLDLADLSRNGSAEDVNRPFNAQALTMAVSVGTGRFLQANGLAPSAVLGFSLGQIGALALAGVLSDEQAFRLLKVRATAMAAACEQVPGGMLALLGADAQDAEELCKECAGGEVLLPANYNCPGQIVISGTEAAIECAGARWKELGNKASRLNTSGAFHGPLMEQAAEAVAEACADLDFREPEVPLICNTDARPFRASEAAARLAAQVKSPVRFSQSVEYLIAQGETDFLEVGFGAVLNGLVKRIDRTTNRMKAGTLDQVRDLLVQKEA